MKYGSDMLDKLKSNKNKNGKILNLEKNRGVLIGSGIGLGIGIYIAYSRGYSLILAGIIGASIGGLISYNKIK